MTGYLIYAFIGALAGLLGGLFGIGGGSIAVPLMVLLLGLGQKKAQGVSLVCACFIACAGLAGYHFHGNVNYTFSLFIIAGAVCGSSIGSWIVKRIDTRLLKLIFIIILAVTALNIIYSGVFGRGPFAPGEPAADSPALWAKLAVIGLFGGILSGLLGIGGGIVLVPCMLLLGIDQKTAQGISLLCIIPTCITGVILQSRWGNVDMKAGIAAGIGAGIFSALGAGLAAWVRTRLLTAAFGVFLLTVTCMMINTLRDRRSDR